MLESLPSTSGPRAKHRNRATPELIGAIRDFADSLPSALETDRRGSLSERAIADARAIGLYGLALPEAYGGAGLALGDVALLVAELARVDRSFATNVGLHNGLGTHALATAASPTLAGRYLPELASGARIASFGATEPGAGSDLSAIRTTATSDDGSLYVTGEKAYVTNAGMAGLFTILARVPEPGGGLGSALLVVPRETEGLSLGPEEHKLGLRASSTRSVFFDRAKVRLDHVIGGPGRGHGDAYHALEWGRTLMSAGCLGTARGALEKALEHTSHRKQFRKTLKSFRAVRAHLAAMSVAVVAIESLLADVGAEELRGENIEASSSALKVLASELACDACDRAIQLHGALGFVEDAGVALMLRDARVTRIFEGANDVLLVRLGTSLLSGRALTAEAKRVRASELASYVERLEAAVEKTRSVYGVAAVAHQRLLLGLARADAWLRAADACLARGDALGKEAARALAITAGRALDDAARAEASERSDDALLELIGERGEVLVRPSRPIDLVETNGGE